MTPAEKFEKNRLAVVKAVEKALRGQSVPGYHGKGYVEFRINDGDVQKPIITTQAKDSLHSE